MSQDSQPTLTPQLRDLAEALGVATSFTDWQGQASDVSAATVVAVLAALGVDASTPDAAADALAEVRQRPWRRMLPPVVVVREGRTVDVPVHVVHGAPVDVRVELEGGAGEAPLRQLDRWVDPRHVDGVLTGRATFEVPDDLPLGWHALVARSGDAEARTPLVITPDVLPLPGVLGEPGGRAWGYMTQLYSVRSRASWGFGDIADLMELTSWAGREQGAGWVLVNPLAAAQPVGPMEASPYLPVTRRFVNPIYIRVEDVRESAYLPAKAQAELRKCAKELRKANGSPGEIDRDAVWAAKRQALEIVFAHPRSGAREAAFREYVATEDPGLTGFATWCALAERLGLPASQWPQEYADPTSPAVAELAEQLADRVEFHRWLQWVADEQLEDAQATATAAGMPVGIVHDLAVGVHPEGADVWALGDVLARGVSVGAPPDAFNQQGQDWSQPPWRPDRLAELAYAPFRDMVRTILRHAGGLRVDHVLGLFRLWWVPAGQGPQNGTYVRYDHEAMIGILALEAHRAGAVVIGEDLGTVEPWVRRYLSERGILGSAVLWFERDWDSGRPTPPEDYRELALASVTVHDLPPTAGYLAGEHVKLRERLGLLTRPAEEEHAADRAEQESVLALLREEGLLAEGAGEQEVVEALHRHIALAPARMVGVALVDAVGDRRTQNQPGTALEYPNWRMPLTDSEGKVVLVDDLPGNERAASLARAVSETMAQAAARRS
ncbi:4-alpha-glucanotransferase [Kineococcus xinjiangensis]|uniref:4-alpha-glucanotransferase n=1 Tax=Kineococcus xinjiangensis TaxID=512762 RepID=A0A2S6IJ06_9ACTN|nr:4-alpha-glucanotransferase [Kineococcus xinjiangensis]PPK94203.1 4-alpha-glucanotransferase [Kineococcus xinjiangensis]